MTSSSHYFVYSIRNVRECKAVRATALHFYFLNGNEYDNRNLIILTLEWLMLPYFATGAAYLHFQPFFPNYDDLPESRVFTSSQIIHDSYFYQHYWSSENLMQIFRSSSSFSKNMTTKTCQFEWSSMSVIRKGMWQAM